MFERITERKRNPLDPFAYSRWLGTRAIEMAPAIDLSTPTFKNAVCLGLLEKIDTYLSYEGLRNILTEKKVLRGTRSKTSSPISLSSFRLAVSYIHRDLKRKPSRFLLRTERFGKESRLMLSSRSTQHAVGRPSSLLVQSSAQEITDPKEITRQLLRDGGGLPFGSLYASYRAAARWLTYSGDLELAKKDYEAKAFSVYSIEEQLFPSGSGDILGMISFGPGEGLGEVEILSALLDGKGSSRIKRIEYLAIDTSDLLLTSHAKLIHDRFESFISAGKLSFVPVLGDLYRLSDNLEAARQKLGGHFLSDVPILATYFGNSLGNDEGQEWKFFRGLSTVFPRRVPLATLVGVSLMRREGDRAEGAPIPEEYCMDLLTLETPRSIMYANRLIIAEDEFGNPLSQEANTEFRLLGPEADQPKILPEPYSTAQGIRGQVYRFRYRLRHALRSWDDEQRLKKGTSLLLYSIIKYDLKSLLEFLNERGFDVKAPPTDYQVFRVKNGIEEYHYAVFSAGRKA